MSGLIEWKLRMESMKDYIVDKLYKDDIINSKNDCITFRYNIYAILKPLCSKYKLKEEWKKELDKINWEEIYDIENKSDFFNE